MQPPKLPLFIFISVASLLVYNSVRSFRSLQYVQIRRAQAEVVRYHHPIIVGQGKDQDEANHSLPKFQRIHKATEFFLSPTRRTAATTTTTTSTTTAAAAAPQRKNDTSISHAQTQTSSETVVLNDHGELIEPELELQPSKLQKPLCAPSQIATGKWVPVSLPKAPYVPKTKHLRCHASEYYKQVPFPSQDWQPDDATCRLQPWDLPEFCRLAAGATVSIIGDSLSWEQYSSLLQLAGARVHQKDQHRSKSQKRNHVQYACNNTINNDNTTSQTRIVFRNDARLTQLTDSFAADFPEIVVLNRGAHYVNDTALVAGIRQNVQELQQWQRQCDRRDLKCHLFWRTTVPGHVGCNATANSTTTATTPTTNASSQPVNDLAAVESALHNESLYTPYEWNHYHWQDYNRQNRLILQELKNAVPALEYTVMDAYPINMRRPDDHRAHQGDCLHNCYPGKMDVYNQLLLHFLTMQRRRSHVERLQQLPTAT